MAWYNTSYLYKKQITIDHTKVSGGSNLSSFPVCVSRTDADLKTVGNGGKVQSTSGFDIIFVDSTETTKLDHEIEKYVASTGEIEMWVRIPTLSASVDTVIYCYFDNSGISTTQENKTGVWDSNYKRVYHLGDGTTLSVADSTSNAQNGTNNSATATSGQIDGGANFNGSGQNISVPTTGLPTGAGVWTFQCWLSMPSIAGAGQYPVAFALGTHTLHQETAFYFNGDAGKLSLGFDGGDINALAAPTATTKYLLHGVYDGTTATFYINGVSQSTATVTMNMAYGAVYIGQDVNATLAWVGLIDEARISSTNRSAGWVTTEYNNQSSPSTFYSVGTLTQQAVNKDTSTRFKLAITAWKSATTRFTLGIQRMRDATNRFKLLASRPRDTASRFTLSGQQFKALLARLHLSLVRTRDMAARLPLSASRLRDVATRFPLSSGGGPPTAHYVLRAFGGTLLMGFQSIATRLNLIAGAARDTASRFRLARQGIKLLTARFLLSAQAALTVDYGTPTSISAFAPGITHVDNTLDYPSGSNDATAVANAKALLPAIPYQNTFIQAWAVPDLWPDPAVAEPSGWGYLDGRVQMALDAGTTPVISLCEVPWWMKGALYSGVTYLIPDVNGEWAQFTYTSGITDYRGLVYAAGYQSPDPYGCRVLDNQFANWLHLVQRVAERYMAPPYNVRYFQVWNELKGYWNDVLNTWDYTTGAGDSSGYNAKHGYTYFYNQTYGQLMTTATALGISNAQIKVGGPYNVINTWTSTGFGHASSSLTGKAYGYYDQRDLDVVEYWLQNKSGAGFITVDGNTGNHDGPTNSDEFNACEKFADVHTWIRGHSNVTYPGATTLPIWWAEWYAGPTSDVGNATHVAAVLAYAMVTLLKAGGAVPLQWSGTGAGTSSVGLWSPTTAGGGLPTPWYTVYKALHVYFPPGTQLYSVSNPVPASLEVAASRQAALLINKTASPIAVTVNGTALTLAAYAAEVVVQKDAAARFKLSINKLQNTITRFRLASVPLKNTTARFPLSLMRSATIAGRLALLATIVKTVQGRLPLLVLRLRDTSARFPLARVKVQDSHAKLPLSIQAMKNAQGRLPLIVLRIRDVGGRFPLMQLQMKDSRARLPLTISRVIGIAAKFMQIIQKRVDVAGRFPLIVQRLRDTSGRLGLARGTVAGTLLARFPLASGTQVRNIAGRIRLAVQRGRDIAGRLSLIAQKSQNAAARMPLSGLKTLSLASRLKVAGLLQKDIATRFPLQVVGQVVKGLMARFKLLALSSRDVAGRFPLSLLRVRTTAARLSLSASSLRGTAGRFLLGQARVFSTSTRLKVAGQNIRAVVGRFPLGSVRTSDATARLSLALTRYRSVSGRFPMAGQMSKGVGGRFKLATGTSAPTFITVKSARGTITSRGTRGTITVKSSRGTITVKEE